MFGVLQPKGIGVSGLFEALWEQTIRNWTKRAGKRQLTHEQYVAFMVQEISGLFENGFPYRHLLNLRPDGKNNAKAKVLRNLGNSLYHPTRAVAMSEALLYYNESIAHAAKGSEARALAYGNRAAVCYHYRRYADCLENVRLARASNYSDRLAAKLKQREEQAKIAMEQNLCEHLQRSGRTTDFVAEELKLCCQAHANVPQMAECLQLGRNAQFGQHIVTSRPLKVGDVVLFEKPFVTMVSHEFRHLRCGYCCSEANCFTLIPCEGCTMEMYCSEECLSKAYQEYHRYECGIVRDLKRIADDPINGVEGIRAVAVAIVTFGNDLDTHQKHLNGLDESKVNAFTMDWNTATAKDIYNTVHVRPMQNLATAKIWRCKSSIPPSYIDSCWSGPSWERCAQQIPTGANCYSI
uniref:MYND-type domain-containing protein n=1 Tax=Anopheles stephensi TaxID=30069 RepID=A0A182YE94_ANOST